MSNIWLLFKNDVKRVRQNIITTMLVIGLICIPSLFSWYNLLACWDVFQNTGSLKVAVANTDEGYKSDLIPLRVNLGDQVVSALRANDQMHWVFTDESDAIEGAKSGEYYAAVVIPKSFSTDMMSFYSPDMEHARIVYYSNEKINPIAPKMTTIGATEVSEQVNKIFEQTISEIAFGSSSALLDYANRTDATGRLASLVDHMDGVADQLADSAVALDAYNRVFEAAETLVEGSSALLAGAQRSAHAIDESVAAAKSSAQEALSALESSTSSLTSLIDQLASEANSTKSAIDSAFDQNAAAAQDAVSTLNSMASMARASGNEAAAQTLEQAAGNVERASAETQAARQDLLDRTDAAYASLTEVKREYDTELKPLLAHLAESLDRTNAAIADTTSLLDSIADDLMQSTDSVVSRMRSEQQAIGGAAAQLTDSSSKLRELGARLAKALASGDANEVKAIIGDDPQKFAENLAAPVELERIAVYPVHNFGSSIAPLYTSLALWIGALLIVVALKVQPGPDELKKLKDPTQREVFFGRFCYIGLVSLMQSSFLAVGNMLFVGVQVAHPLLYLLCFWISGLVFTFTMYTLVALFANLGKSLGVILLVLQISGGGGSYPLEVLPPLIRDVSPFLPITHSIDAMRAAMFGVYQNDFWLEIGQLLLFLVPLLLLVLLFIKPLKFFVPKFVEAIEKSKIM